MDPSMQQQQYYYAPGATAAAPPGYFTAGPPTTATTDANGFVLPMQQQPQPQMMYYAPQQGAACPPPPGYAYAPAPIYYQAPEAAFAAMSLSGQTMLPMQQMQQPQQTPGASSTTSKGSSSQPRAASTPIPNEEPASLAAPSSCNPTMIPMHVMYTQMPQYYPSMGYDGQPMPMMYDPTGMMQHQQHLQHMQQQQGGLLQGQQQNIIMRGMMSTDPDEIPENIDDFSQISHHSSPDSFIEAPTQQRMPTTPVSSMRRRVSLPASSQNGHIPNLLPSNYKTRMCTQWLEKRECSMGTNCKFAHGNAELRLPERPFRAINNPKYKTKMCKNFEPGASGLCAYAERCEYIHPTDREYTAYKTKMESIARSRGDFTRCKNMFDEVPGVARRGVRGADVSGGVDEEKRSSAGDSWCGDGPSPQLQQHQPERRYHQRHQVQHLQHRQQSSRGGGGEGAGGYLGSGMPTSMTRSAIRMGAGSDCGGMGGGGMMKRAFGGGSMYNLASGTYSERDDGRRLPRVPSASNVASLGATSSMSRGRYVPQQQQNGGGGAKFSRRASMCHLNTVEY